MVEQSALSFPTELMLRARLAFRKLATHNCGVMTTKRQRTVAAFFLHVAAMLLMSFGSGAAEPFFFIQLTDPQFGMFTDNTNFTQETANFEFAVATVNRLRPAFVVITGDLVNKPGDTAQIAEYRRIVGKIDRDIPVHDVAGNHDVENVPTPASVAGYTNIFGADHGVQLVIDAADWRTAALSLAGIVTAVGIFPAL